MNTHVPHQQNECCQTYCFSLNVCPNDQLSKVQSDHYASFSAMLSLLHRVINEEKYKKEMPLQSIQSLQKIMDQTYREAIVHYCQLTP